MDDFDLPEYVDGAEEVLSAIAEIPGVEWTVAGYITRGRPEKGVPVQMRAKQTDGGDGDLFIVFPAPAATQFFTVSFSGRGDPFVLVVRVAACIRSLGYACSVSTKFISEPTTENNAQDHEYHEHRSEPKRIPAPFYTRQGDVEMQKTKKIIPPQDKSKELDRAGRELFQAINDTTGVVRVVTIKVGANDCGDTKPEMADGRIDSHLLVKAYSPDKSYTFQVTRGGTTTPDDLRRRLKSRITDVDVEKAKRLEQAGAAAKAALPPAESPPPVSPTTQPSATSPAQPAKTSVKRRRLSPLEWKPEHIAGVQFLLAHAYMANGVRRVNTPTGLLKQLGGEKNSPLRLHLIFVDRGVLTDPQRNGKGTGKNFAIVAPTVPGITWTWNDGASADSETPTPPIPSVDHTPPPTPRVEHPAFPAQPPAPPVDAPADTLVVPPASTPNLTKLSLDDFRRYLDTVFKEVQRRGCAITVHNGEPGLFIPFIHQPEHTGSS